MRRFLPLTVLAAVAVAALAWPRPAVGAEAALGALAADETAPAPGFCWLEDFGIGVELAPVPVRSAQLPRLLAADAPGGATRAWFYQFGSGGGVEVLDKFKDAEIGNVERWQFTPRAGPPQDSARLTHLEFENGDAGMQAEWQRGGYFALVVRGPDSDAVTRRRDELLSRAVMLPGGFAPLIAGGRYACALPGWARNGARFFRRSGDHWLGLRFFHIPKSEFADLASLQLAAEGKLAGFRRSDGAREKFAGADAFLGEYFGGAEGFVQRIWFAPLEGSYLLALMQAPEAVRAELTAAARALATSTVRVDLAAPPAPGGDFALARAARCAAWQEGRAVRWGALFDDARGAPVLWRQPGIEWSARLLYEGKEIAVAVGTAAASRELNPLASPGALELPNGITGPVDVVLRIGGLSAQARVMVR